MTSQKGTNTDGTPKLDPKPNNIIAKSVKVDYDDLLSSAGEFGRYQVLLFFSTFPFYAFGVFVYFSQIFITEVSTNYWCWIPELGNLTEIARRNLGVPRDDNSIFGYSQCKMYVANWSEVLITGQNPGSNWSTIPCQYGWEFNKTEIPYPTISSELGWVCNKNSYQANAQAIFSFGSIAGGFLFGWMADRFGRLPTLVASNLFGCAGGVASTFASSFIEFATSRFFIGMAYDNCMVVAYLLMLEYISPRYRTIMANMAFALFYSLFVTILPWIALVCGHWKTFSLVTSVPLALALLTPLFIPESARWLLSKGRVDNAINKARFIGRINKKEIPEKLIEQFKTTQSQTKIKESQNFSEIFKRPLLRRVFILICLEYMCCAIVFDGLVRSIGSLDFDFFLSFSVVSFTEFPSMIAVAFIMDWMGRRLLTIIVMYTASVFCLLTVVSTGVLTVTFAVIARFAVNMSFATAMQWAAEILPTPVRGSGTSVIHVCGYLATILSPYIVYLKTYLPWLPFVVIGCIATLGGFIAFYLPETAMKDMPQTFDDAENLAKNQRIWTMPCMEKKKCEGHVNNCVEADC